MIDLKALRDDPDTARASQVARGADPALVDQLLAADERRRSLLSAFEQQRAEQKELSRSIGKAAPSEREAVLGRAKQLAEQVKDAEAQADAAAEELDRLLWAMPNIIVDGVPAGGEEDFVELRQVGTPRDLAAEGIEVQDHLAIAEGLRAIDTERGAKVGGSRFYFLTGIGSLLEMALLQWTLNRLVDEGFTPMTTPTLVRPEIMAGTGFLGAHADEVYRLAADDLYLVGTSEVALAGYHSNEILDLTDGPVRYAGFSACYRREAGSHGKDVRGIIRTHQFHKVEMFVYAPIEEAEAEHERMLAFEEASLTALGLPYRVIDVAAGDLGSSAARKYDCEAWLPSQQRWLELTSTSNCTTFQARRLGIRERTADGRTRPAATLNGTGVTTRWLVALLENHQQADGSVVVPEPLRPYLGGRELLEVVR
ncbi:MAG TPA: serine--tRNA ligase [Actinotalea caeni]|uniref:serine--tRNA ligase n=1 Tax=Actinotalea caeni TaxID=1348467 RepID=UPI0012E302AD|nr:serine--tRNA ligase [Actinotalea caeni]HLV54820.1 serine--tRNA ligase [Actinotalea caeni]